MSADKHTEVEHGRSLWADAWAQLRAGKLAVACMVVLAIFALTAIYGTVVYWRYNIINANPPGVFVPVQNVFTAILRAESVRGQSAPYDIKNLDIQYQPPGWASWKSPDGVEHREYHLMGTDGLGRDVFLRLVQGTRIAFQVGIVTSVIAIVLGVLLGCIAGFLGGWVDDIVVWFYSTLASLPSLLFILSIAMVVEKGLLGIYIGVGLMTCVRICRLVRGEVMKHKELTYVKAARVLGLSKPRIMFRHILPNIQHIVIINFSLGFPAAIETEVIMSFLGIGVQDQPSWGLMISSSRSRLWHGVWWELAFTTLAIFAIVLAFNLLGDALRDALDPRLRSQSEKEA